MRDIHSTPTNAERAAEPVQSHRSASRASLLMRLSSDVRRCREDLPEAARRRLPWLITAACGGNGSALSRAAPDWDAPWGQRVPLWGGVSAYVMRSTAK